MVKIAKTKVLEAVAKDVGKLRWWPREAGVVEPKIVVHKHYFNSGFMLIQAGASLFQFPYAVVKELPEVLKDREDRFIELKVGEEKLFIVEAEYTDKYFGILERLIEERWLDITREKYFEADLTTHRAEPLFPDSTNTVGLHISKSGGRVVVKSYRKLDPSNVEPLIMAKLSRNGFKNVPTVYQLYRINYGGVTYSLSIVLEYIEGEKDLGRIYWQHLGGKFSRRTRRVEGVEEKFKQVFEDEEVDELTCKVGSMVADMHFYLNAGGEGSSSLESISGSDVDRWLRRIDAYVKDIGSLMDNYVSKCSEELRSTYEQLRSFFDKVNGVVYDNVSPCFKELFENALKGDVHQDLHFQQMMYRFKTEKLRDVEIYILDFEGEPGRADGRVKEPLVRDIATLANSFMYIWFFSYKDFYGEKIVRKRRGVEKPAEDVVIAEVSRRLVETERRPLMHSWVVKNTVTLALSYSNRVKQYKNRKIDLLGFPDDRPLQKFYVAYLTPWIYERTLYEIRYELQHRPSWFPVPLVFLKYPALPYVSCRKTG